MRVSRQDVERLQTSSRSTSRDGAVRRASRQRPEREIQRAILDFLRAVPGVVTWKTGGGLLPLADGRRVRMGHKGVSDIVGWVETAASSYAIWPPPNATAFPTRRGKNIVARFLAIEVKRPGKKPTDEQQAFLDAVTAAGGIAIVASSVEDVALALGIKRR